MSWPDFMMNYGANILADITMAIAFWILRKRFYKNPTDRH